MDNWENSKKTDKAITIERLEYYLDFLAYVIENYAPRLDACIVFYERIENELIRRRETLNKRSHISQRFASLEKGMSKRQATSKPTAREQVKAKAEQLSLPIFDEVD